MLTPRAIMVGQYRLVLAVSTGIRAQGHLWALPEHPECSILASLGGCVSGEAVAGNRLGAPGWGSGVTIWSPNP